MSKKSIHSILSKWTPQCDSIDIELIIAHSLKKDRIFVMTNIEQSLTNTEFNVITNLCTKRLNGYPLAYILGSKQFYGRDFKVTNDTLIPRPETELMIDKIITFIKQYDLNDLCIVDIGTGSGIIAVTLALECKKLNINFQICANDVSKEALNIAKQNAVTHKIINKIIFYQSDLLQNTVLQKKILDTKNKNIIFAANLPYVNNKIKSQLIKKDESVALTFEPQIALWSKDSGLAHYKKLISQTTSLNKKITSFYEIDDSQYSTLAQYLRQKVMPPLDMNIYKDLSDKKRLLQWTNFYLNT